MRCLLWVALVTLVVVPIAIAALNPLQTSRSAPYIVGGLAGVCGLAILLLQPLLAVKNVTHSRIVDSRRWHLTLGISLVF